MRLGLLDDQSPVARVRVLGQLAQDDGHVDQVVEARSRSARSRKHRPRTNDRRPSGSEVAGAKIDLQQLRELAPSMTSWPAVDGFLSILRWRRALSAFVELDQGLVEPFAPPPRPSGSGGAAQAGWSGRARPCEASRSGWEVDAPQVSSIMSAVSPSLSMLAAPSLGLQPAALVGVPVAD